MRLRWSKAIANIVFGLGLVAAGWAGAAPPVAVLVEASAGVTMHVGGVAERAPLLQMLEVDIELHVAPKARAVVLYLRSGDELVLTGPAAARVGAAGLLRLEGQAPVLRKPAAGQEIRLRPDRLAQGGLVLRNMSPPSPSSSPTAQEIERRRPGSNAPLSARVSFALWLEDVGAVDEARAAWRALAAEWPGHPALAERAAR